MMKIQFLLRTLCLLSSIASLSLVSNGQSAAPATPQVQVTFYSSGNFLKSIMPGYKYGQFRGRLMDEYDTLAMLNPGRFITFNLDAGPHTFTATSWLFTRPEGGAHLKVDLVAGKHYYMGTYLEPLVLAGKFRIVERDCKDAQQDNENTEPLDRKHLRGYGASRVVLESSFPSCSSIPAGKGQPSP